MSLFPPPSRSWLVLLVGRKDEDEDDCESLLSADGYMHASRRRHPRRRGVMKNEWMIEWSKVACLKQGTSLESFVCWSNYEVLLCTITNCIMP